jgi:hypothetical protein
MHFLEAPFPIDKKSSLTTKKVARKSDDVVAPSVSAPARGYGPKHGDGDRYTDSQSAYIIVMHSLMRSQNGVTEYAHPKDVDAINEEYDLAAIYKNMKSSSSGALADLKFESFVQLWVWFKEKGFNSKAQ